VLTRDAFTHPRAPERHVISFERGQPAGLDGKALSPVQVIEALESAAAPFGIGRGIHLGDTIIGTKGRVAFEAPAAETLLTAHRELENGPLRMPWAFRKSSR
jgi:argininosuccinate synthase